MKKTIALLLALCVLFGTLAGCSSTEIRSYSKDKTDTPADKYAAAMNAYKANKQVLTVDGSPVYWNEYAYWLNRIVSNLESYGTEITDWSAVCDEDSGKTYAEYVQEGVLYYVTQYHAMAVKAADNGITLDEEGQQYLTELKDKDIANYCGESGTEQDFEAYLKKAYLDMDIYEYLNQTQYLISKLFAKLYGENGENLSDEDVNAFREENGYMTAKHILFKITDDSGSALSDEEKAEKKQQAESVSAQLRAIADQDARVEKFDALMAEYNEDTGEANFPGGYCFASGQMVEAFEEGTAALAEYEVSGVVESSVGYHVILRLPTTADDVVQIDSSGNTQTLRYMAASSNFQSLATGWTDEAEVVWEPAFASIDYAAVYTPKESFWKKLDVFGWFD